MAETRTHAPGSFCWVELATSDPKRAVTFYASILGWDAREESLPDGSSYTMFSVGEKTVAGMYALTEEQSQMGAPPHWMPYVAVLDAEAAAIKANSLGGSVVRGAFDVMELGRMAVLQDPTGAYFSVWQAKQHAGSDLFENVRGARCWTELMTSNVDRAGKFYADLFGWKPQAMPMGGTSYTMFLLGETPVAGMMAIAPGWGKVPPNWLTYFVVHDCDAAVQTVKQLGGKVPTAPTDIPGIGRFALIEDPQGAALGILKPAPK